MVFKYNELFSTSVFEEITVAAVVEIGEDLWPLSYFGLEMS